MVKGKFTFIQYLEYEAEGETEEECFEKAREKYELDMRHLSSQNGYDDVEEEYKYEEEE